MKNKNLIKIGMNNTIWINKYVDGYMAAFETRKEAMSTIPSIGAVRRGIKYVLPEDAR